MLVNKKAAIFALTIHLFFLTSSLAYAAEQLIYTNETTYENANTLILDNDNSGSDVILQFGSTLNERLFWDNDGGPGSDGAFILTDDVKINEDLDIEGVITTGSSNIQITNAAGNIDGEQIADDSIDDDSIDFGMGSDQVGANDLTMTDEFFNSNNTNVQDVTDDIDAAIGARSYTGDNYVTDSETVTDSIDALDQQLATVSTSNHSQNTDTGTTENTFTLDSDDTGGDVTVRFGTTLNEQVYWDNASGQFIITDDVNISGNADINGTLTTGSSNIQITNAAGNMDGEQIIDDSIDDDSIDFGMSADQIGADDITMTDEFDNSNNTNTQDVVDDIDAAIGDRIYTDDNYVTDSQTITDSIDNLDQQIKTNADNISGGITGTDSNTFTLDQEDTGGNVDLIFGTTIAQYIRHDGTLFQISDDLRLPTDKKIEFRDSALSINSSVDGQLDLDADTEIEITAPTIQLVGDADINGNLDVSGTLTNATIDGDDNTIQDLAWNSLNTRSKKIQLDISDITVIEDTSNNQINLYSDSENSVNPHEYYLLKTTQTSLQDLDLKLKVKLPEDFVDFSTANDISFNYKNTGTNSTDSKIDILVEDDDGDDAFLAADGLTLFSSSWSSFNDEFDQGSFNPVAGEYIYITVKGYASYDGGYQSPYIGEIVLSYTGR